MKLSPGFVAAIIMAVLFYACSSNSKERSLDIQNAPTESQPPTALSSTAAVENPKDTAHKFIRTADIKFKVKNVASATYAIENIVNQNSGFVSYTNLNSTIDGTNTIAVSADSSLETTYYTVVNTMALRVPNVNLDTTLKSIALLVDYLDYRIIKADNVALQLLGNKLTQNRATKHEQRLTKAIDSQTRKLEDVTAAEELLLNRQEQKDNALLSNLSLHDQINYSTVSLNIYQRQAITRQLIYNYKNINAYQPALSTRLVDAVKSGWMVLESIIVTIAEVWWLILFVVIGYVVYRMFKGRL